MKVIPPTYFSSPETWCEQLPLGIGSLKYGDTIVSSSAFDGARLQ